MVQNFILNTVSGWFNDKEMTNGSFRYKLRGNDYGKGLNNLDLYTFIRRRNLQEKFTCEQCTINFCFTFLFKSIGKHLKSVGGTRLKNSVDYRVNR